MRPVRTRGPRRRGDNHQLVRSVPTVRRTPPPIPLLGYIDRTMKLEAVADYAGLSDTAWTSGTTGNYGGVANTSWNALYHHFVVPNRRDDTLVYVMDPIRWSTDAPASNGGTYDWWYGASPIFAWYSAGTVDLGRMAISQKILASASHGAPAEGYLVAWVPSQLIGYPSNWSGWATLAGISGNGVLGSTYRIAAIQHRVNGVAVGSLQLSPPSSPTVGEAWRVSISSGDTYEIDIWYEIKYTANPYLSPIAGKCCLVALQTLVSNGSRRPPLSGMPTGWRPQIQFRNVNWNTAFDRLIHTYNITIAGHVGWTLKGGSDGPHKMITGDGWVANIGSGGIRWTAPSSHQYVESFLIDWTTEIPRISLKPKDLLLAALGWSGWAGHVISYRPRNSGDYRESTVGSDWGATAINSAPCGVFSQSGSTTWDLVGKSTTEGQVFLDGYRGFVSTIADLPLTITTSRTSQ